MKIKDITDAIESIAPLCSQESYDNSGLIIGNCETDVASALLCVDVTESVMDEAQKLGVDLIISHHPIIFNPLRRINQTNYVERVVARALRCGIAVYASHTNLDASPVGLSHYLAEAIGLKNTRILSPGKVEDTGFGVIGSLDSPVDTRDFIRTVGEKLSVEVIRHSQPISENISRIAICSGSGASLIDSAQQAGAELYLASDFKYNNFLDAAGVITIADIGHFESEYCAIDILYNVITKKIPTFALYKSRESVNPVHYLVI